MAEEWMVESSDDEVCSSLGSEGLGGAPKRKHVKTSDAADVEIGELYKRIARDGYVQLQCVEKRRKESQQNQSLERKVEGTKNAEKEKETKENKSDMPVTDNSTFDFCDDIHVIPTAPTPQPDVKRAALKGSKKRKPKTVAKWSNVIRHLQIDYENESKTRTTTHTVGADVKDEDTLLREKQSTQPEAAHGGIDLSFSMSSIDSSMTKDGLQDKIKYAETLLASQQVNQPATEPTQQP